MLLLKKLRVTTHQPVFCKVHYQAFWGVLLCTDFTKECCWKVSLKVYCKKYDHTYEYEYHTSVTMEILIPSATSVVIIFLILSSPHGYKCLTSNKAGCTLRKSLRLWIRWVRHRSWTWTESYSFVIVLGHGQIPILSNKPLDKLDVTARLLMLKQERQMCETMQSSHRLCPVMVMVRALLVPTASDDGDGPSFCTDQRHFSTLSEFLTFFYPCFFWNPRLVRWIMVRLGKVGREVVEKLDYQW